jgi:ribonuclease G
MQKHRDLTLFVHPIMHAYLTKGIISMRRKWGWKYKLSLKVKPNNTFHLTEFHFYDRNDEEIKL